MTGEVTEKSKTRGIQPSCEHKDSDESNSEEIFIKFMKYFTAIWGLIGLVAAVVLIVLIIADGQDVWTYRIHG